jgi:hypothetical protein
MALTAATGFWDGVHFRVAGFKSLADAWRTPP